MIHTAVFRMKFDEFYGMSWMSMVGPELSGSPEAALYELSHSRFLSTQFQFFDTIKYLITKYLSRARVLLRKPLALMESELARRLGPDPFSKVFTLVVKPKFSIYFLSRNVISFSVPFKSLYSSKASFSSSLCCYFEAAVLRGR